MFKILTHQESKNKFREKCVNDSRRTRASLRASELRSKVENVRAMVESNLLTRRGSKVIGGLSWKGIPQTSRFESD